MWRGSAYTCVVGDSLILWSRGRLLGACARSLLVNSRVAGQVALVSLTTAEFMLAPALPMNLSLSYSLIAHCRWAVRPRSPFLTRTSVAVTFSRCLAFEALLDKRSYNLNGCCVTCVGAAGHLERLCPVKVRFLIV